MPFANHLFADAMLTQEQMSDQVSECINFSQQQQLTLPLLLYKINPLRPPSKASTAVIARRKSLK
jgi:hypothetical protein